MNAPTSPSAAASPIRRADPGFLSTHLSVAVVDFEEEVIGADRGFISTTSRLRLRTEPEGAGPASVVLKSESANPAFRGLARQLRAFEREVRFYRDLAPPVADQLATVYACGDGEQECWLLMEDLSHLRAGDQVRGLAREEVEAVVRRIAAVHAHYWLDPVLERHDWLPSHRYWFSGDFSHRLEGFSRDYGLRLGDEAVELVRRAVEANEAIDAALAERPWTLVHGDLRADNLLFGAPGSPEEARILDWQTVNRSLGAMDVMFLVGGSEPVPERQGHVEELLALWHGELRRGGVRDYDLAEARRDLQLAALRCLNVSMKVYEFLQDPAITVRAALLDVAEIERHTAAALELRAWEALP